MPVTQRRLLDEAMDDERVGDLLEERSEAEQTRSIDGLDMDRLLNVLDEMEYDDVADLLAEMPGEQRLPDPEADGRRRRRVDPAPAVLRGRHGRRAPDAGSRHRRATATWPRRWPRPRSRTGWSGTAAQVFIAEAPFVRADGHAIGASCTSSGCCESRRHRARRTAWSTSRAITPDLPNRSGRAAGRYNVLAVGGPTRAGCSERSPSTTCSTTAAARMAPADRWRTGRAGRRPARHDLADPARRRVRLAALRPGGVRALHRGDRGPRHRGSSSPDDRRHRLDHARTRSTGRCSSTRTRSSCSP